MRLRTEGSSDSVVNPRRSQSVVQRTVEVHAWLLGALLLGVLCMMALLLLMLHVHAGDVAYIAHAHRPIIVVPTGAPPVVST